MFGAFGIMIKKWIVSKPNSVTKYQFLITEIKEWKKIVDFFGELTMPFLLIPKGENFRVRFHLTGDNPLSDSRGGWVERDRYIVWYWLSRHMMYMFTKVNRYLFSNSSRSCSSSWMRFLEVFVSLDRWKNKFKLFEMFLANDLFAIGCMMESANRKCGWFWITDYSFVGYLEFTVSKFRQKCKSTFNQL